MKLADLSSQQSIVGSPFDLINYLKPSGEVHLLGIVCEAYENLFISKKITCDMEELQINEELYVHLVQIWINKGPPTLTPVPEKSHKKIVKSRGKSPTIDICFRDNWNSESYFGIECKILEDIKKRYDYYIDGGVCRYVSSMYSENTPCGVIVGYIMKGDILKIINEVITRVKNLPEAPEMDISYPISNFKEHYKSVHLRVNGCSPFDLHHLFFCFI